jgi:hypothetical protein
VINEGALWYKRGDLVEFKLTLGGGPKICRALVLNSAVLFGRGARELWILVIDASLELRKLWTNKKHIVHEEDIIAAVPSVLIGADTILRDNPICYPVRDIKGVSNIPAVTITVALPTPTVE